MTESDGALRPFEACRLSDSFNSTARVNDTFSRHKEGWVPARPVTSVSDFRRSSYEGFQRAKRSSGTDDRRSVYGARTDVSIEIVA